MATTTEVSGLTSQTPPVSEAGKSPSKAKGCAWREIAMIVGTILFLGLLITGIYLWAYGKVNHLPSYEHVAMGLLIASVMPCMPFVLCMKPSFATGYTMGYLMHKNR